MLEWAPWTIRPIVRQLQWWELTWEDYLSVWPLAKTAQGWLVIFEWLQKNTESLFCHQGICQLGFDKCQAIITLLVLVRVEKSSEILCKQCKSDNYINLCRLWDQGTCQLGFDKCNAIITSPITLYRSLLMRGEKSSEWWDSVQAK